ncbi:MAG TPA: glycoside hydrolase family 172 protein [Verrucomicrobiae bacterium]|jgi:hypothetical protein|nr:glycoside hydrolase family 172 protein [Verrucomicrobiae bacterium]
MKTREFKRREFVASVAALGAATLSSSAADARASTVEGSRQDEAALAISILRDETTRQATTFNLEKKDKVIAVPRGARKTIASGEGCGYIAQLWLTFPGWFWQHWNADMPVNQSILKTLILRIYWDDAKEPAVAAPAGDFFGAGLCQISSFASRYFGTSSGGFFCKWPMPFRKNFRIEVENTDSSIDTVVFCNVLYQLVKEQPADAGYFHTQFNTARNDGPAPVPIAAVIGRGHYAGCQLYMQGKERNYLSFLEAPEYVWVDDDWERPRFTGTGLEDYFLGGWYFREGTFIGGYNGLPIKDPLNASVAMYRIHESDAIRFRKRFKFAFVNPWSPDRLKPFCYSSVAFLYLDTPEGQGPAVPAASELLCWYRTKNTDHQSIP